MTVAEYKALNKKPTNADKIRTMTDEELARFIQQCTDCSWCKIRKEGCCVSDLTCRKRWLEWLKQEAGE